jgi:aminobenzoyl-glutamate transport protein
MTTPHDSRANSGNPPATQGFFRRLLDGIEVAGNRLPDPLILFVFFAAIVPILSWIIAQSGWTQIHPGTGDSISVVNLLTRANLQRMFTEAVPNFTAFPPLGTVLVAMIGIGVAERSGFISTLLRMAVVSMPRSLVTAAVVFAGVMSSMATDAGYVVLTPLGAVLFASLRRHPIAGLCAAFAGVSGGFSANLLLTSLDPLLAGFTQSAAQIYDAAYEVAPSANYYFMVASVFLVTGTGWLVTERIVEPRLGKWDASKMAEPMDTSLMDLEARERRAAWIALAVMAVVLAGFAALSFPEGALLRDANGRLDPFYKSLVPMIAILFIVPGIVYGALTGSVRNSSNVARMTGDTMATMGSYIVLAFAAAQFVAYFNWSNLGLMLALGGAQLLKAIGLQDIPLLLGIVLLTGSINLFIGSASAKWGLMAPVIVPMMMHLGFSPELAQASYRVGDSITNIITPLLPYFPIILAFAQKYDPSVRLGTLISSMLPYSIAFGLAWSVLLIVWYLFGIPLGPEAPMRYEVMEAFQP